MLKTLTAVSLSRLLDFETCPQRVYLRHIAREKTPEYDDKHPLVRGRRVHKECEDYISGKTDDFPSSGKKLKGELDYCREQFGDGSATVEDQWGFDSEWNIAGWFDADIWLRLATDCYIAVSGDEGKIYDWKTGKSFGNEVKYMQQMQLYAGAAFMRFPELEICEVTLGFLDDGKMRTKTFTRGPQINKIIAKFVERFNRMTSCVDFRPKPNALNCKFCPFGPTINGGTGACPYGVEPL